MLIQIGATNNLIDCFEAVTPEEQAKGLSECPGLPLSEDGYPTGLLFFYDEEDTRSFWMPPQMRFPIDMVFIGEDGKVTEVFLDCQPGERDDETGQLFQFKAPAKWVLEVPSGVAKAYGIVPQTQINFDDEETEKGGGLT